MPQPRRTHAEARAAMQEGIVREGRRQLRGHGPAKLSVRAIARQLEVAPSAVYRYVRSRDELLTILLIASYEELASYVEQAADTTTHAPRACLERSMLALREWAVEHPEQWALLYGTPVVGYDAPASTEAAGTRVIVLLARILSTGNMPEVPLSPALHAVARTELLDAGVGCRPEQLPEILNTWTATVGLISAEVFGHLGAEFSAHGEELFQLHIDAICSRYHLP